MTGETKMAVKIIVCHWQIFLLLRGKRTVSSIWSLDWQFCYSDFQRSPLSGFAMSWHPRSCRPEKENVCRLPWSLYFKSHA